MYYHSIDPFILRIAGNFGIRWYSTAYIIGFIAIFFVLQRMARKGAVKNFTEDKVEQLIMYLVVGVIVGARLFHVFVFEPSYYLANPADIIKVWNGGLSFHGGLVGAALAIFLFSRRHKVRFLEITDIIAIPLGFFLMLGRIANFINGELYGTVTNVSWCVDYSKSKYLLDPPSGCRHPSQLYEAAKNLFIGLAMVFLYSRETKKELKKGARFGTGFYTFLFLILYGVLRFFITFLRDEPGVLGTGISEAQWFSLAMAVVGGALMARWAYQRRAKAKR